MSVRRAAAGSDERRERERESERDGIPRRCSIGSRVLRLVIFIIILYIYISTEILGARARLTFYKVSLL